MTFHSEKSEKILEALSTDLNSGLSSAQVTEKLAQYGENKLREKKKKTMLLQTFLMI